MALVSIDWNPAPKQVRGFAVISIVLCAVMAGWALVRGGVSTAVYAWGTVAAALAIVAMLSPTLMRRVYVASLVATFPIGWVMSHILLAAVFFGLFTPLAIVFRLLGRDALERRFEPSAQTYWRPKTTPADLKRYLQQF